MQLTSDHVAHVMDLAQLGLRDRLDVDGPAPARLVHDPAERSVVQLDDLEPAAAKHAHVVWSIETALLKAGHSRNSRVGHDAPRALTARTKPEREPLDDSAIPASCLGEDMSSPVLR